jgi:hypothetical protein
MMHPHEQSPKGQAMVSCYLGEVPAFVEDALASRYQTLHSSLPFFRVWRSVDHANCYVALRDGEPEEILLFVCKGGQVNVLNEMIDVAPDSLKRFTSFVFEKFPNAELIRFNAVATVTTGLGLPVQRYNAKENFVITLPDTPEAYMASLGKSTRANLRSRLNHARKDFPSLRTELLVKDAIGEDVIRAIVRFSEHRIAGKGVRLKHDIDRIIALCRACGFVNLMTIDGRICAGSLGYRVGDGIFGEVSGHDPEFESHGFGALCVYHTACAGMETGARKYYLGGGTFEFKERMLGKRIDMDQVQIYRSYPSLLANLDRAALAFTHGQVRALKKALHKRRGTLPADLVFRLFHAFKNNMEK